MSRQPGVHLRADGTAEVLVWAPLAKRVDLLLVSDGGRHALTKGKYGYWEAATDKLKPGDGYFFVLDDDKRLPDIASLSQPEGVHGPSQAICLAEFKWGDQAWINPPLDDYIIYEIHTGTFTAEGTFAALEGRLDYLLDLGITAIELMPVAQFPGGRNWGYDGVFPYAVQNSYGGAERLMHLIDACHQRGMAVIIDVVYNHLGPEGNHFNAYGAYFTGKYTTPWGGAINFDDAWCDAVRNYFIQNALMWFRDFHADALRLDAVHAIKDFSPTHILREVKQRVNELHAKTGKGYHLMVELDLNDSRFIDPLDKQGYGMDAQWVDEFHHALRVTAGGERSGYYSDFNGIRDLAKSYNDAYVYDGIYSPHRLKTFGNKVDDHPGSQFVVFSQNHDQVGNRMLGERSSQLFSFEMQKLMAGAVLASPFIPLLFMGEEFSAPVPFLYFTDHGDPELAEAVRKGRRAEFKDFHGDKEAPDPQAGQTLLQSKLPWEVLNIDGNNKMLDFYKTIIALRKQLPALRMLDRQALETAVDEDKKTLVLLRWHRGQQAAIIMNFSRQVQPFTLPPADNWQRIADSADQKWNGPGLLPGNNLIQPESFIIYLNGYV